MLLNITNPIKYNKHNIIIEENKEKMLFDALVINNKNSALDMNAAKNADTMGLNIQFETSNTMQDTCKSLNK